MIDLKRDLLLDSHLGIESIQAAMNQNVVNRIVERNGKSNLIIARHIFEHARRPRSFLNNIFKLVKDKGLLLLELPDYSTAFKIYIVYEARRDNLRYKIWNRIGKLYIFKSKRA